MSPKLALVLISALAVTMCQSGQSEDSGLGNSENLGCVNIEPSGCELTIPTNSQEFINSLMITQQSTGKTLERILAKHADKGSIELGGKIYLIKKPVNQEFLKYSFSKIENMADSQIEADRLSIFDKKYHEQFMMMLKSHDIEQRPEMVVGLETLYIVRNIQMYLKMTEYLGYVYSVNIAMIIILCGRFAHKMYKKNAQKRKIQKARDLREQRMLLRSEIIRTEPSQCNCSSPQAIE